MDTCLDSINLKVWFDTCFFHTLNVLHHKVVVPPLPSSSHAETSPLYPFHLHTPSQRPLGAVGRYPEQWSSRTQQWISSSECKRGQIQTHCCGGLKPANPTSVVTLSTPYQPHFTPAHRNTHTKTK